MEIILLESFDKLGNIGDTVVVKDGFARNYLLPQKKALRANKANKEYFEKIRQDLEKKNKDAIDNANKIAKKLENIKLVFLRQSSESGQLYGSVSAKDIAQEVTNAGLTVNKSQIMLNKTLKTLSFEDLSIKLHPEVLVELKLNIARSIEEAKEQSRTRKAIITTEVTGGDIRSERAQKDAKRFEKKNNVKKNNKTTNIALTKLETDTKENAKKDDTEESMSGSEDKKQ